jgi:hypothetical protein
MNATTSTPANKLTSATAFMQSSSMRYGWGANLVENSPNRIRSTSAPNATTSKSKDINSEVIQVGDFLAASRNDNNSFMRYSESSSNPQRISSNKRDPSVSIGSNSNNHSYSSRQSISNLIPMLLRLRMCRDCVSGVEFLHSNGFMHCDIKSLNFLVTKDLVVKLSDLGEARSSSKIDIDKDTTELPRNVNWSSPEILGNNLEKPLSEQILEDKDNIQFEEVSDAADIWSLGFVISEILTGEVPFDSDEIRKMPYNLWKKDVFNGKRPNLPTNLEKDNKWLYDLVTKSWSYNPKDRCSAKEMMKIFNENSNNYFE